MERKIDVFGSGQWERKRRYGPLQILICERAINLISFGIMGSDHSPLLGRVTRRYRDEAFATSTLIF